MSYDLRHFFHTIGTFAPVRALADAPAVRTDCDTAVELLDTAPVRVDADPLDVDAYVDGIQHALCITHRGHRPVYLAYVAAGAADPTGHLIGTRERLDVIVSAADADWYRDLGATVPSIELPATAPDEVTGAATALLGAERETLERSLVEALVERDNGGHIVVDGNLVGRPIRTTVTGVVKTTQRRYLPDESVLWGLPAGWRSPRFAIPAGSQGVRAPRYSCYVRLHPADDRAWNFGLIRLETFDADLLDPLAARALRERQPAGSHDRRYDRHLAAVRAVEDLLRARRPAVFSS